MRKDNGIYIGRLFESWQLLTRLPQSPVFVSHYDIAYYDGPLDIEYCTEPELMKKIY